MTHRVNVILQDEVWNKLQAMPKGTRSTVINEALKDWLRRRQRKEAGARLDALRESLPPLDVDIVELIRMDRERPD